MNISIIGTGAYGLSIALALIKNNHKVTMWVESEERVTYLNNNRKNANILPGIEIPEKINIFVYLVKVLKKILANLFLMFLKEI